MTEDFCKYVWMSTIVDNIFKHLHGSILKHGRLPEDDFECLAILSEEYGEFVKALNHYHWEKGSKKEVLEELYQLTAMCLGFLEKLENFGKSREWIDNKKGIIDNKKVLKIKESEDGTDCK